MPPAKKETSVIELPRIEYAELDVTVEGLTPVIPHCWSEKSLKLMRDKQMSEAGSLRKKREPKNPDEEAEQSCYWLDLPDGTRYGAMPAVSFKAAMVAAVRDFEGLTMVAAKTMFYVKGEGPQQLVRLTGKDGKPAVYEMREDTPRNASGVADLRYRMSFYPWQAALTVRFKSSRITPESIVTLIDAAGTYGVGDWRPNSPKSDTGTFGQFRVVTE